MVSVVFQCGWTFQCDFQCHILIVKDVTQRMICCASYVTQALCKCSKVTMHTIVHFPITAFLILAEVYLNSHFTV